MLVTYSEFLKNAESNEICLNFIRPFPDLANSDFSSKSGRLTRRLLNNIFNCNTKKGIATDIGNQCTPLRNTTGDFRQICPKLISPHFKFGYKCPVLQSSPVTPAFAAWTCSVVRNFSINGSALHRLGMDFSLISRSVDSVNDYFVYIFLSSRNIDWAAHVLR